MSKTVQNSSISNNSVYHKYEISSIYPIDRILSGAIIPGAMAIKGCPHSPKLQHHWDLAIRLFSFISRTLIGWCLTPLQKCCRCILQAQPTEQYTVNVKTVLFQIIRFSISSQFRCQNSSISNNSV